MSAAKSPLAPGYYWYQETWGSEPILVYVREEEVYSPMWSGFRYLFCGEDERPPFLTSYATGVYAGPIAVPDDLSTCGLPIVTVAGASDARNARDALR